MAEAVPGDSAGSWTTRTGACWVNGRLVGSGEGSVAALDHSIIVGDGVFETTKVIPGSTGGTPFALTRHLERLRRSAEGLGIAPADDAVVRSAVAETLAADPYAGRLRITWTSGTGPLGSGRGDGPGTLIVATEETSVWPESDRVHLCRWSRNEHGPLVGLKTTSYAENVLALEEAHRRGCGEALFANTAGLLCEGTGTNVFLVVDGVLVTPPLSSGCLAGVTRELVLEIAAGTGHPVVERDVHPDEFSRASEAFLTSSTRDVMAISGVDPGPSPDSTGLDLPAAPGPVTSALAAAFAGLCAATPDP
ncbi:MAG: aminotransferase class IV [Acidimicrobiales bacterium]|nr:aminotransferase class IV [Acidimicrobiales bacterium]